MFKVFRSSGIEGSYSVSSNPLFVSDECWTIFPAKHRTTGKKVSVWQFNKREYELKLSREGILTKNNQSVILGDIYSNLKTYISNLTKLKHPNFVTVIEPLEEHKSRLLFVTEYVVNDLETLEKSDINEIIVTKGLLQIANGLKFLHESLSTVHLNISPCSIFVTENSDWKVCGLQFMQKLENSSAAERYIDPLDSRMPSFLSIDFRFSSPNLLLEHNVDFIDDLFSLGCLVFYLFNNGQTAIQCDNSSLINYERSFNRLNHKLGEVANTKNYSHPYFSKIPQDYLQIFFDLLIKGQKSNNDVIELTEPFTINSLINSSIFNSDLIKILNTVDTFDALSSDERISLLSKLRNCIDRFPKTLLINKFIPLLSGAISPYVKVNRNKIQNDDKQIITLSMENILLLSKTISQLTFSDKVFPVIKTCLQTLDIDPVKALIIGNLDLIRSKLGIRSTSKGSSSKHYQTFKTFLLEIFKKSVKNNATNEPSSLKVQECILGNLRIFLEYQPYSVVSNQLLPAICDLFSTTTSLKVKVLSIKALIMTVEGVDDNALDNYTIIEKVLPPVRKTQASNLKNHEIFSNILGLYRSIFKKLALATDTISVGNQEVPIYDVILESLFFEVWKLTKYVSRRDDKDAAFLAIGEIEQYLRKATSGKVSSLPPPNIVSHTEPKVTVPSRKIAPKKDLSIDHHQEYNIPSNVMKGDNDAFKSASLTAKLISTNNTFDRKPALLMPSTVASFTTNSASNTNDFSSFTPVLQTPTPSPSPGSSSFMTPMKVTKKNALDTSASTNVDNNWRRYESSNVRQPKNQKQNSIFEPIKPTKRLR